ncbi:MAG: phosphonoacetaldehyde hydrolase [Calditerrivibrio sp.]|nr:phosphonoacetaldehyde hydrolase [Calditerrivibrio sp.]MCA1931987.1 phosphonoacetaldehyde hydrolase [Calditerrivibrio sp.]MCA1980175.1 phosphonoacetaldehyde hydrolase [Calditerrivibrio sp.]
MKELESVIFDWAGTTIDFGCIAPLAAFKKFFLSKGVDIKDEDVRRFMGLKKIDQLNSLFNLQYVRDEWRDNNGKYPDDSDIRNGYESLEGYILNSLTEFAEPITGVIETVDILKKLGVKIGSTTGYTKKMMDILAPIAESKGYCPDSLVCSDEVIEGRPFPYMCYENAKKLKLSSLCKSVKVGDTISDIREGLQAGMWSVGVIYGGNEFGISKEEMDNMDPFERHQKAKNIRFKMYEAGAHAVIYSITELPLLCELIDWNICKGSHPKRISNLNDF